MKKVLTIILMFFLIVSYEIVVNADMGVPEIKGYHAKINKIDGVDLKNLEGKNIHLNYGDEVDVYYEYEIDGEIVAWSDYIIDEKKERVEIPISFLSIEEETHISDTLNKEKPIVGYVYKKSGLEIYKGPAEIYEKYDTVIPYGEKITMYEDKAVSESPWFFVEYNGISGWVNELNCAITYELSFDYIVTNKDTKLRVYNENTKSYELKYEVPANTVLLHPLIIDPWSQGLLVSYNGQTGIIEFRDAAFELNNDTEVVVKEAADIYSKILNNGDKGESLGKVPVDTKLTYRFVDNDFVSYIFIEYNGIKGWIESEKVEDLNTTETKKAPTFDISLGHENVFYNEIKEKMALDNEKIESKIEVESETVENVVTENEKNSDIITPNDIVLYAVTGAIIISLTCIVSIVLINKNINSNKEEK